MLVQRKLLQTMDTLEKRGGEKKKGGKSSPSQNEGRKERKKRKGLKLIFLLWTWRQDKKSA